MGEEYDFYQDLLGYHNSEALRKKQERQYNLRLEIGKVLKLQQAELAKLEKEIAAFSLSQRAEPKQGTQL